MAKKTPTGRVITPADPIVSACLQKSVLDASQRAFCTSASKHVRLLAPAGSGKTLSLLWRCLNLAAAPNGSKHRFLVITFTRAARDELKDRVDSDPTFAPVRSSVEVSTLNSWGFKRVKAAARSPKLYATDQERYFCIQNLLQPVWKRHAAIEEALTEQRVVAPKAIMRLIDDLKGLGFVHTVHTTSEQFAAHLAWLGANGLGVHVEKLFRELTQLELIASQAGQIGEAYQNFFRFWGDACQHMSDSAVFTLEDQKYWALIELNSRIEAGKDPFGQSRYTHLLVDEFQDINTLDINLLRAIATVNKAEVTVVGDDDQAIFEWRGATPQYILQPDQHFGAVFETCTLEVNYRSPRNIVALAQSLIRNNGNRVNKRVRAKSTKDARVEALQADSLTESIDYVVREVQGILSGQDPDIKSVAIVGRKRSQIIPYQVVFASRDIAFCAAEDLQVFLSKAFDNLKDLLLIKARASSPRVSTEVVDDLLKLCDHVKRYPLKKTDRQALRSFLVTSRPRSLVDGLNALVVYKGALKGGNDDGEMSEAFASAIRQFLGAGSVKATIRQISESLQGLQKDYGKAEEDIFYTDPPFIYLSEYADRYGDDFFGFIEDIEKAIATLAIVPSEEEASGSSGVWKQPLHLMTALRAKGKEFDAVFLLDVNDGIWPSKLAESDAQKEQERRVFYVAMTRARKRLVMLSNRTILDRRAQPSPYLAEMGLVPAPTLPR